MRKANKRLLEKNLTYHKKNSELIMNIMEIQLDIYENNLLADSGLKNLKIIKLIFLSDFLMISRCFMPVDPIFKF